MPLSTKVDEWSDDAPGLYGFTRRVRRYSDYSVTIERVVNKQDGSHYNTETRRFRNSIDSQKGFRTAVDFDWT